MKVFVIGLNGIGLMPTSPRKARLLLQHGKATVVKKTPFTIRLNYKTGCSHQQVYLGIDTGSKHIGAAVVSNNEVQYKAQIDLRQDVKNLLTSRREYRRGRRYRKTRYRRPKFKFHTKRVYSEELVERKSTGHMTHWIKQTDSTMSGRPEGWLPPSIQGRIDNIANWIRIYQSVLPLNAKTTVEVGRFDIARMKDPTIHGELYQRGPMYDCENIKAYVFARDGYTCQCCGAKAGTVRKDGTVVKLADHHIVFKSKGGSDLPYNRIAVCDACHTDSNHKHGKLYDWMVNGKKLKTYKDAVFMSIVRKRMFQAFPDVQFTYGNITAADRKRLFIEKSHANDAAVIALCRQDVDRIVNICEYEHIVQARKKKRSLHEATPRKGRKLPNYNAVRNSKNTKSVGNHKLHDKVSYFGQVGFISGFTGNAAYVKDVDGNYITAKGKSYKQIPLRDLLTLRRNNNWISIIRKDALISVHPLRS